MDTSAAMLSGTIAEIWIAKRMLAKRGMEFESLITDFLSEYQLFVTVPITGYHVTRHSPQPGRSGRATSPEAETL